MDDSKPEEYQPQTIKNLLELKDASELSVRVQGIVRGVSERKTGRVHGYLQSADKPYLFIPFNTASFEFYVSSVLSFLRACSESGLEVTVEGIFNSEGGDYSDVSIEERFLIKRVYLENIYYNLDNAFTRDQALMRDKNGRFRL